MPDDLPQLPGLNRVSCGFPLGNFPQHARNVSMTDASTNASKRI